MAEECHHAACERIGAVGLVQGGDHEAGIAGALRSQSRGGDWAIEHGAEDLHLRVVEELHRLVEELQVARHPRLVSWVVGERGAVLHGDLESVENTSSQGHRRPLDGGDDLTGGGGNLQGAYGPITNSNRSG